MCEREAADLLSLSDPVLDGGAEVNTRVNAGLAVLGGRLRKARKRARQAGERNAARNRKRHIVVMEEPTQHLGSGTAEDAVGRGVVGNIRSVQ